MGERKRVLELDKYECGVVYNSLLDKRNQLLDEDAPTEDVDSVLLKVIELVETFRRGQRCHETR